MCPEDGWGMWQGEGAGMMIIAPVDHTGGCSATAPDSGLAVLPAKDGYAKILRGEHYTTVSKLISLLSFVFYSSQ